MPPTCPHCNLDIEDAARAEFYAHGLPDLFEMGCPWCNRAVIIRLDPAGELRAETKNQ